MAPLPADFGLRGAQNGVGGFPGLPTSNFGFFLTGRTLQNDFLNQVLAPELITNRFVFKSENF